jgi:hypothetical protein
VRLPISESNSKTRVAVSWNPESQAGASSRKPRIVLKSPGHADSGFALIQIQRAYGTSIVVTLYAGKVSVSDEPLTAIVPMDTGVTGLCPSAVVAVI